MNHNLPRGARLRSPKSNFEYEITDTLGSGGFGITYLATTTMLMGNIPVTVKVAIKEHFLSGDCERKANSYNLSYSQPSADRVERSRKSFLSEARRLCDIAGKHSNIVRVNEVFEANDTAYYVMEYLEGESLKQYVDKYGPLSQGELMAVMMPIVDSVVFLHSQRITHLDIKPANIMLTHSAEASEVRPVLIDFGLSKHFKEDGSATSSMSTVGASEGFAPIEQYTGISYFSPASDVYSLGATMVYCLSGKTLPKADELKMEDVDRLLPADINRGLKNLIKKCLAYKRDERPADAGVLMGELESLNIAPEPLAYGARRDAGATRISKPVMPIVPPVSDATVKNSEETRIDSKGNLSDRDKHDSRPRPIVPPVVPPIVPPVNNGGNIEEEPQESPKAGPVPQSQPVYPAGNDNDEPQNGSRRWILWLIIFLAAAGAGFAIYHFVIDRPYQVDMDDEGQDRDYYYEGITADSTSYDTTYMVEEVSPEVVAVDSAAAPDYSSDSYNRAYYDRAFHELSGPVKSITNQYGEHFYFDSNGNWTNDKYDDELTNRWWEYSGNKRQYENYTDKNGETGYMAYDWDTSYDRWTTQRDYHRGTTVKRYYRWNGAYPEMYRTETTYDSSSPSRYAGTTRSIDYTNYQYDSYGNWTSRYNGTRTETRAISYYY